MTEAPPLQLADLWAMVRRRRVVAATFAVLVGIAVFVMPSLIIPPLYRAEATLTMDRAMKPVSFQADPTMGQLPDQLINTQCELLASKSVLSDALAMGGLLSNPAYARTTDPVTLIQRRLRTSVVKSSWVITVTLDDEDPVRAEAGLQSVLDAFLAHQATQARSRGAADITFVDAQLSDATAKLQTALDAERLFREQHAIASTDPDHNHITARIQTLADRQGQLDERVAASSALLKQVQAADTVKDPQLRVAAYLRLDTNSTITLLGSMQKTLFELQGEEAELAAKYLDKHPRLIEVRSHLAALRTQLDDAITAVRASIEADHQMLVEQRAGLVRAQEDLQRELNAYRGRLIELQRLTLASQAQQKVHDELLARQAQLTAMSGYDDRRMTVDAAPRSSPVPRGIGFAALATLACLLGSAAAVASAALADSIDRTVRDGHQVQVATGLRTLAIVPVCPGLQPLCASGPTEPAEMAEAMRALRTALRYAFGAGDACRVVLIVSPQDGDGRSTLASRIATATAMAGSRTLLIDADLRNPTLTAQLGVVRPDGLAELLAGVPDLAPAATAIPNLELMPAGQIPANPGELLNSHCLGEWLAHVRPSYDLIVLDAPSLSACSDSLLLADHADAILVTVRPGMTERQALVRAWEQLAPIQAKVLGCVPIQGA